jgi:hypothetical protein
MTCSKRLSAARRWLLRRPTPRTTSETHAWLTALEQQALAQSHLPACSGARIRATGLSWPGEAMTALQLGNCDLVRLRGTS